MRTLVVIEFLSLDGVMQSLGGPDEDTEGGFRHGGWSQPYMDDVLMRSSIEGIKSTDAYLFGRRTYEKFVAYWPTQPDENPMAAHLNATPKYVASRTLDRVDWRNAQLLDGDVPDAVRALKSQDGGSIAVLGSGVLVRTLFEHELVDELRAVHPPADHRQRQAAATPSRRRCARWSWSTSRRRRPACCWPATAST